MVCRAVPPKPAIINAQVRLLMPLALALLAMVAPLGLRPQTQEKPASLRGTVRDSRGKPVAGATIRLQAKVPAQSQSAQSDHAGMYSFNALHGGVYSLSAETSGYRKTEIPSVFLSPSEAKMLDLVLLPVAEGRSTQASPQSPQFFDEPRFSVAGVTDTTSLGGHGSDTVVRTRETLAKETVSLSAASGPPEAEAEREASLRESLRRDPNNFDSNQSLGKTLVESGRPRDALPYLEKAASLKPADFENSYELALANDRAGNYAKSRTQAEALVLTHDSAELHHLLADVQEKLGNSLEAVREYQRAATLDAREPYVFDWGAELLLHHAPEPALEVFSKGHAFFPRSTRMLVGMGAAEFARGSYDQADQYVCEASDLNPDDPDPYRFLGKMQHAEPAPSKQALERLHRFVQLKPHSAEANYYYAVALWKQTKGSPQAGRDEIESLLRQAIHLDPKFASAYLQLGVVHAESRNLAQAIADYQQAIQADPSLEEAHYRLAQAYRQAGESAKADGELKLYSEIAKESAEQGERERHEIRQFVYTLRDQAPAQ